MEGCLSERRYRRWILTPVEYWDSPPDPHQVTLGSALRVLPAISGLYSVDRRSIVPPD